MDQSGRPPGRWPGHALWLLAVALTANALLGPLLNRDHRLPLFEAYLFSSLA